jgi:hypothetical protein
VAITIRARVPKRSAETEWLVVAEKSVKTDGAKEPRYWVLRGSQLKRKSS